MLPQVLELAGVGVFAVSGALSAGRKGLDVLGVVVIAAITAIGGGTLRDLLLDRHPIFWIADSRYLVVILLATAFTLGYVRVRLPPMRALLVADALGLALFSVSGARIAQAADLGPLLVLLMGTMTAVAGGVLRDVLSAEVPLILRRDIYATAAIAGIVVYLALGGFDAPDAAASLAGMTTVFALRMLAIVKGFRLPVFRLPREPS